MNKRIQELNEQIKRLEAELRQEIQRIRLQTYEIRDRAVHFRDEIRAEHRAQLVRVYRYLRHAKLKHLLTAPVIWLCLWPALLLDLIVTLYQAVCFPVYGIPKVKRADHIAIDRHYLGYLNVIEKLNCLYCSYFNGVLAYVREIAGRTEQYWCPIKHAAQLKSQHSRYGRFAEYGDAETFRREFPRLRQDFTDTQPFILHRDPAGSYFTDELCHINELCNSADDPAVSVAEARVEPGVTTRWHRLRGTVERYVILSGSGSVEVGDLPPTTVTAGSVVVIPASCRQRIRNSGSSDLVFLALCSPRFEQHNYEDIEHAATP